MNWVSYLINELEKYCREAQDQGYEFHFSWLLVLIAFVIWKIPEGATFLELNHQKLLATKNIMVFLKACSYPSHFYLLFLWPMS
jgi:hypothetical protein